MTLMERKLRKNQRVEGEQLQKIARAAEAFMQLYEDLRRDAK